jgi:hypothetical protein
MDRCAERLVGRDAQTRPGANCLVEPHVMRLEKQRWQDIYGSELRDLEPHPAQPVERTVLEQERTGIDRGEVEIRDVKRRQIFIGGKPVGSPFE